MLKRVTFLNFGITFELKFTELNRPYIITYEL